MRIQYLITWLAITALLSACAGEPKSTPSAPTPPAAVMTPAQGATDRTQIPQITRIVAVVTPAQGATATAVGAAAFTATPASPGGTPVAQPSPAMTQSVNAASADARLATARWLQFIGDCDSARREFAALLDGSSDAAAAAEARYRMAQCYLRDAAPAEASVTLAELLNTASAADPYYVPARFLLGEALSALSSWAEAEKAYTAYLSLAPEVAYLTWQRIGAARRAQDNLSGATEAYRAALAVLPDRDNEVAIRRALADLALAQGDPRGAVAEYDTLAAKGTASAWSAEMHYLAGVALAKEAILSALSTVTATQSSGSVAPTPGGLVTPVVPAALLEAQQRWQAAVDADVTSSYAHAAIVALLDSGASVDEYQRGRVNYHKGNYELAIAAFDRLLAVEPAGRDGAAFYYRGLSYLAVDQVDRGIADLDRLIAGFSASPLWADAWLAKGRSLARAGREAEAIAVYRRLAEMKPDAVQAPKALWQVALLTGQPGSQPGTAAADAYLALARRYPKADEGWRAYQNAGLTYFRLGDWRRAAETWQEMAAAADLPAFTRPVAYYWLGRAQAAAGDRASALRSWQSAREAGSESFYGLRAAAWASGKEQPAAAANGDAPQTDADPAAIAAWLKTWAGDGSMALPDRILADPDWQRGETLLALGLRTQAMVHWARVWQRERTQPWTLTALAQAFAGAGAYRLALLSAEDVVALSGKPMAGAPLALQRLAYPFPYESLIRAEAAKWRLDPRLLAAIIRQESRFETGAASSAGAQGLMQVMPGTAQGIANQLGWSGFEASQAYWPYVNIAFGAFYIQQWLDHFGGSVFTALAAYNGGPGNATIWYDWAPQDDDLMAALININETRVYVQAVWVNYEAYQRLYPQ